jgi:hypothetical protein
MNGSIVLPKSKLAAYAEFMNKTQAECARVQNQKSAYAHVGHALFARTLGKASPVSYICFFLISVLVACSVHLEKYQSVLLSRSVNAHFHNVIDDWRQSTRGIDAEICFACLTWVVFFFSTRILRDKILISSVPCLLLYLVIYYGTNVVDILLNGLAVNFLVEADVLLYRWGGRKAMCFLFAYCSVSFLLTLFEPFIRVLCSLLFEAADEERERVKAREEEYSPGGPRAGGALRVAGGASGTRVSLSPPSLSPQSSASTPTAEPDTYGSATLRWCEEEYGITPAQLARYCSR